MAQTEDHDFEFMESLEDKEMMDVMAIGMESLEQNDDLENAWVRDSVSDDGDSADQLAQFDHLGQEDDDVS